MRGGSLCSLHLSHGRAQDKFHNARGMGERIVVVGEPCEPKVSIEEAGIGSSVCSPAPEGHARAWTDWASALTPPSTPFSQSRGEGGLASWGMIKLSGRLGLGASVCRSGKASCPASGHLDGLWEAGIRHSPSCQREETTSPCRKPSSGAVPYSGKRGTPQN